MKNDIRFSPGDLVHVDHWVGTCFGIYVRCTSLMQYHIARRIEPDQGEFDIVRPYPAVATFGGLIGVTER